MIKVLGICCSPRLHGNTEILVQESLAKAQGVGAEIELVRLAGKTIAPCDGCLSCRQTKVCRIKDDMQDIYRDKNMNSLAQDDNIKMIDFSKLQNIINLQKFMVE